MNAAITVGLSLCALIVGFIIGFLCAHINK